MTNNIKKKIKKTYIIKSMFLKPLKYKKIINDNQQNIEWLEFDQKSNKNPDWIHTDGIYSYDKSLWKYTPKLQSSIDFNKVSEIINKFNLIEQLKKLNNKELDKLILDQYKINLYKILKKKKNLKKYESLFDNKKIWIFKPIYGHQGKGIIILKSFNEFKNAINEKINNKINQTKWNKLNYDNYKNMRNIVKFSYNIEWVLQEYILNPLLYKNKKFHLRGYLVYESGNNKSDGFIFGNHRIFTAKLPYKNDDYLNKDIHDTHITSTPNEINYNPDIIKLLSETQENKINKEIKILFNGIIQVMNKFLKCYPKINHCYHFFASDIMITDDYQIKFIELNTKPGMGEYNKQIVDYPHLVFQKIFINIVNNIQ